PTATRSTSSLLSAERRHSTIGPTRRRRTGLQRPIRPPSPDERALIAPQMGGVGVPDFRGCRGAAATRGDEFAGGLPAQDLRQMLGTVAEPFDTQPAQLPR